MKKIPVNELLRLACWHAEQWYESLVDSYSNCTGVEEVAERERNQRLLDQTRAYRLKHWGRTRGDALRQVKPKTLVEVFREEEERVKRSSTGNRDVLGV